MSSQRRAASQSFEAVRAAVLAVDDATRCDLHKWVAAQMSAETGQVLFPGARGPGRYVGIFPAMISELSPSDCAAWHRWFLRWIHTKGVIKISV